MIPKGVVPLVLGTEPPVQIQGFFKKIIWILNTLLSKETAKIWTRT